MPDFAGALCVAAVCPASRISDLRQSVGDRAGSLRV